MSHPARPARGGAPVSGRGALLALGFVILSLFALALVPALLQRRTSQLRADIQAVAAPARSLIGVMQVALANEFAGLIGFQVTEREDYRELHERAVARQGYALERLDALAPRLGPDVAGELDRLRELTDRWHESIEEVQLFDREVPRSVRLQRLFERHPRFTRTVAAAASLEQSIGRAIETREDEIFRAERLNTMLTIALAIVALVAALAVGWIGWRLRASAAELERRARALAASEERFRELAEHIHEVFWTVDPGFTRILYISPAYEEIWGRSVESVYRDPRSWLDTIHPEDRDRARGAIERMRQDEYGVEYRIVRPDGEVRWVWVRGFPVRDEAGRVYRVVGLTEDITARKEREAMQRFLTDAGKALAASLDYEQTLRSIARLAVESIADWCIIYMLEDDQVRRLEVAATNPEQERRVSEMERLYPPAPPHPVFRVLGTGEPRLISDVPEADLGEFAQNEEHLRLLREIGFRSIMFVPLVARGRTIGAIAIGSAESRRRFGKDDLAFAEELAGSAALAVDNARLYEEAQEARGEAERRARQESALRQAAEAVSVSFTVEDVVRQIAMSALQATNADGAYVERIDVEADEVEVAAAAGEITPPVGVPAPYSGTFTQRVIESGEPEIIAQLTDAERPLPGELARTCPECSALVIPLIDAGEEIGSLVLLRKPEKWIFRADEIERAFTFGNLAALAFRKVHLLEETEKRREELEQVMESRSRLMRGFSHDVKNPLGAADGFLQLLEQGVEGELAGGQKESIARARHSIGDALRLIEDLLELARAEAGQIEVEHQPVNVGEATEEIAEEHRAKAEAEGLAMEVVLPDELPMIESDAGRIRQILGNLLSNAVKYTPEGGRITVRVEPREGGAAPGPGRWIAVDVGDTGPGIPEEKRHLLFQEFKRIEPGAERGAGLGLAISRRIARALRGDITVESEEGEGSTFTLWLPLERGSGGPSAG